ncbi:hypothetical protein T4D_7127 [Trichinella pseudospiralis]|uniref:Uncharacterized protein n=1 Tax=Trichinella pseudospiralis TaxID=6337 RepID=A0A0V1FXK9_TRIPS|nr:hypothetical protein T4D_7127 [Trichinella pseudospiralis]
MHVYANFEIINCCYIDGKSSWPSTINDNDDGEGKGLGRQFSSTIKLFIEILRQAVAVCACG